MKISKITKITFVLIASAFFANACSKRDDALIPETLAKDVYTCSKEYNGVNNVAKVWKNGIATTLSDGTKNANSSAINIVGADIYVAGGNTTPNRN